MKHFSLKNMIEVETRWQINKPAIIFFLRFTFSTNTHTYACTYVLLVILPHQRFIFDIHDSDIYIYIYI